MKAGVEPVPTVKSISPDPRAITVSPLEIESTSSIIRLSAVPIGGTYLLITLSLKATFSISVLAPSTFPLPIDTSPVANNWIVVPAVTTKPPAKVWFSKLVNCVVVTLKSPQFTSTSWSGALITTPSAPLRLIPPAPIKFIAEAGLYELIETFVA